MDLTGLSIRSMSLLQVAIRRQGCTLSLSSGEERIYLRWSTDTYITSHMVEAVGNGVNYSAVIPAQPAGTSVQYCITTSTVDLSQLTTAGSIDFLTLATTSNTQYVVAPGGTPTPTATPPPTPTPTATQ